MTDNQLDKLRTIEEELLQLQRGQAELAARAFRLHEDVCDILLTELARPLA